MTHSLSFFNPRKEQLDSFTVDTDATINKSLMFKGQYSDIADIKTPSIGDVVLVDGKTFVYCDDNKWDEIGDLIDDEYTVSSSSTKITHCPNCGAPFEYGGIKMGKVMKCNYCGGYTTL